MDGRREPVAYQLNTCSRVTQTPTVDGAAGKLEMDVSHDGQRREEAHEELDDCDIKAFNGWIFICTFSVYDCLFVSWCCCFTSCLLCRMPLLVLC